jgi:hypothetical protein
MPVLPPCTGKYSSAPREGADDAGAIVRAARWREQVRGARSYGSALRRRMLLLRASETCSEVVVCVAGG